MHVSIRKNMFVLTQITFYFMIFSYNILKEEAFSEVRIPHTFSHTNYTTFEGLYNFTTCRKDERLASAR